jgi:transcriptional regulator with XRE-family HTH domain
MRRSKGLYKVKGYTFLERLFRARKLHKTDVARVLGCSNQHLHRICNDYVMYLTLPNLYKLAGLVGLPVPVFIYCLERSRLMTDAERMTFEDGLNDAFDLKDYDDSAIITPDKLGIKPKK